MSRYVIHCDNPEDIPFGIKAIYRLMKEGFDDLLLDVGGGFIWYVKKTKTGYAAKLVGEE
jgi:hypothetical protein